MFESLILMSRLAIEETSGKEWERKKGSDTCYATARPLFFQPRPGVCGYGHLLSIFPCVTHVSWTLSFRRQQPKTAKRTHRTHAHLITTMSTSFRLPYGYNEAPPWPSLYWPFSSDFVPINLIADVPHSLYYLNGKYALFHFE